MKNTKRLAATAAIAIALPLGLAAPAHANGSCYISDSNHVELASATVIGNTLYVNLGRGQLAAGSIGSAPSVYDRTANASSEQAAFNVPGGRTPLRISWQSNTGVLKSDICYINV